jgi:hypothetical protein
MTPHVAPPRECGNTEPHAAHFHRRPLVGGGPFRTVWCEGIGDRLQDLPSDRLEPSFEPDPDVLTLVFQVKVDRARIAAYHLTYPGFRGETPAALLIREALNAWHSERLVLEAEGRRSA